MHKNQSEQEKSEAHSDQPELLREGLWEIESLFIDIKKKRKYGRISRYKDKAFLIILEILRVPSNQCYCLKREQQEID